MKTGLIILRADGSREDRDVDMAGDPGLAELRDVLEPILAGRPEHVTVLHRSRRADMFVDEAFGPKGLPRNEAATSIYRAAWLRDHPADNPETLPWIAGPAVIFDRIVWS
ncbi:hypothetical protein MKK88_13185 [Methylobacterium sp. E-005]|uniref:hypothetical protein n=1 Tax=Methylobacterium sp. E-005 TaxID=2836549 RepID=UPI001FBB364D|nr:hypothetical protein [Methylobacterium sp. E-005]MCJ2086935.1 hypothetical protein [Methylobacterium sp. E-005]